LGPGKEAVMQANTGAPRHLFDGWQADWNHLRNWKQKTLTKERLADIALIASTTGVLGYVVWWAAKAAESYTILGLG
jgi:hypothetical protein